MKHLAEPCFPTAAGTPQECCVPWRGQGQDERGGADRSDAAAPERLHEREAEESAAPSQSSPRPQHPTHLQSGKVLLVAHRPEPGIYPHCHSRPWPTCAKEVGGRGDWRTLAGVTEYMEEAPH
jgi:hypothetical protein